MRRSIKRSSLFFVLCSLFLSLCVLPTFAIYNEVDVTGLETETLSRLVLEQGEEQTAVDATLTSNEGVQYNMKVYALEATPVMYSNDGADRQFTVTYVATTEDMTLAAWPPSGGLIKWDETGSVEFVVQNTYRVSTVNGVDRVLLTNVAGDYLIHQTGVGVSNEQFRYGCSSILEVIDQHSEKWFSGSCSFATNFTQSVRAVTQSLVGSTLYADLTKNSSTWDFVFSANLYGGNII